MPKSLQLWIRPFSFSLTRTLAPSSRLSLSLSRLPLFFLSLPSDPSPTIISVRGRHVYIFDRPLPKNTWITCSFCSDRKRKGRKRSQLSMVLDHACKCLTPWIDQNPTPKTDPNPDSNPFRKPTRAARYRFVFCTCGCFKATTLLIVLTFIFLNDLILYYTFEL